MQARFLHRGRWTKLPQQPRVAIRQPHVIIMIGACGQAFLGPQEFRDDWITFGRPQQCATNAVYVSCNWRHFLVRLSSFPSAAGRLSVDMLRVTLMLIRLPLFRLRRHDCCASRCKFGKRFVG